MKDEPKRKRTFRLSVSSMLKETPSARENKPNTSSRPSSNHSTYSASSIYQSIPNHPNKPEAAFSTQSLQADTNESDIRRLPPSEATEDVCHLLSNPTVTRISEICPLLEPILTVPEEDYLAERQLESEEMKTVRSTVVLPKKATSAPTYSPKKTFSDDSFLSQLHRFDVFCTRVASIEDARMASEIQKWKRSSEPLATRSDVIRRAIESELASRESRLQKQAVYQKSVVSVKEEETSEALVKEEEKSEASVKEEKPLTSKKEEKAVTPVKEEKPASSPHALSTPPKDPNTTQNTPTPSPAHSSNSPEPSLLTIPAPSLIATVTELLAASADRTLLGSHYEDVRELLWKLKGTLNKITGGHSADRDARLLLETLSCPCSEVKAILRAQIADQLIHRGCETREVEVCEGMASVLAELMALDHAFVPIVMGVLYQKCPLLIPEIPQRDEESDREFEERTNRYRMSVLLYCSICKHATTDGTNPCDLRWVWYLLESINRNVSEQAFLEYAGFMEPLLSCAGSALKQKYPNSFGTQVALMKSDILPKLERINGKTTGQIARLDKVLHDLSA